MVVGAIFSSPCPIRACPLYTLVVRLGHKVKHSMLGGHALIFARKSKKLPFHLVTSGCSFFSHLQFFTLFSGSVSPMFVRLPCGGIGVSKLKPHLSHFTSIHHIISYL